MRDVSRETTSLERQIRDLAKGCEEMGLSLTNAQAILFSCYLAELLVWNKRVNLVSRQDTDQVAVHHFLDSLSLLPNMVLPATAEVMDLGSGAGLPGIPLKIVRPDLGLVLVESTHKKALFLKHIVGLLDLSATRIVCSRAEELQGDSALLGHFDMVVARAVSHLSSLVRVSFPFVRQGGCLVAYKGGNIAEELAETLPMMPEVSGQLLKNTEIILPICRKHRRLLVFTKS